MRGLVRVRGGGRLGCAVGAGDGCRAGDQCGSERSCPRRSGKRTRGLLVALLGLGKCHDGRTSEGRDDDRRHLPVPVEAGVHEERDCGPGGGRDEGKRPVRNRSSQGIEQEGSKQAETDRAKLGERLDVEGMCIQRAALGGDVAPAQPVMAECAGT